MVVKQQVILQRTISMLSRPDSDAIQDIVKEYLTVPLSFDGIQVNEPIHLTGMVLLHWTQASFRAELTLLYP